MNQLTSFHRSLDLILTAIFPRRNIMNLAAVSAIAKSRQISPGKLSKTELIRMIQSKEGNFDCFATASAGECNQVGCSWRDDCFDAARKSAMS
jgi:hypothetical protein